MAATVFIEKHHNDVAKIKNPLDRKVEGGEFIIAGQLCGVVDRSAGIGEPIGLQIESFLEIQVGAADLETAERGYAEGSPMYFSQASGRFADAPGTLGGFAAVGQIAHNRLDGSGGGVVTFFKYPLAVA